MGNRADRRASAKIAKQAVKRAKTPVEGAILRAAGAFAGEGAAGLLAPHLSDPDFDAAWTRLAEDLHDILEEHYPDFLLQAFVEAGMGALRFGRADIGAGDRGTRLFLCPLVGARDRVAAFAASPDDIGALALSLRQSGIVDEAGACYVLPHPVDLSQLSPADATPGRVRAIHDILARRLAADLSGTQAAEGVEDERADIAALLPAAKASSRETALCALIGIELLSAEASSGRDLSEEALDAEDMAAEAAEASWYDSYAADLAGLSLGAPLDWPSCTAALAVEGLRLEMDAARSRRGLAEGRADTIHCAPSADGDRLVVSAVYGTEALGPFSVPAEFVWFDADAFFDRLEASTETLLEHEDEGAVIAPLLGAG
ncbi:hypothetical protein ASG43_11760 [Aureimonas sp. Leaf454]|uniref:hypothetical protein n=1 Tax=Aureimonas sp. Leaf454 TaxID=1736381 RepID=UPI0006F1F35E|nr:hypothetical protein [Aureimonas sp. Leaf454]KQT46297.1 hypothetical protein ASG43_11760 [Aureimonas sp. Leaf454]